MLSIPFFFAYNNLTVEVHPGYNGLCCGGNRTGRFTGAEERVMGFELSLGFRVVGEITVGSSGFFGRSSS